MNELLLTDEEKISALMKCAKSVDKNVTDFDTNRHVVEYVENGHYQNDLSLQENYSLFCQTMAMALLKGNVHKKCNQN